eukprot:13463065-Ditylum_brightwellii.AAC.1
MKKWTVLCEHIAWEETALRWHHEARFSPSLPTIRCLHYKPLGCNQSCEARLETIDGPQKDRAEVKCTGEN